jgi:hypothetical protein
VAIESKSDVDLFNFFFLPTSSGSNSQLNISFCTDGVDGIFGSIKWSPLDGVEYNGVINISLWDGVVCIVGCIKFSLFDGVECNVSAGTGTFNNFLDVIFFVLLTLCGLVKK